MPHMWLYMLSLKVYLRNFFNDLADLFFQSTGIIEFNRIGYLKGHHSDQGGFFFYDLTSFTSWSYEQVPFLQSLDRFFTDTGVYLVGENMTSRYHNVGSLIDDYTRWCNDFPPYIVSKKVGSYGPNAENLSLFYQCADFLAIPGHFEEEISHPHCSCGLICAKTGQCTWRGVASG